MTHQSLPEPIAAYFEADRHDGEAVARCFIDQGVVRDEGQIHVGPAAIKAWKSSVAARFSYAAEPLGVEQKDGRYIVASRVTGNFPGSPTELRFIFRLERGKISSLEITP